MSRSYFSQVAREWDALRTSMYSDAVRDAALERAALHPTAVVADIGAGTGFLAQGLAPLVARVHVVDQSLEMIAVARQNLAAFDNVEYHIAEGTRIPLPDASLDAVLANMYLHHAHDPLAAIREMVRLLRPGGRLVITDMDEHPYTWLREEHHDVWLGFDRGRIRSWFEAAGLVNVRVEDTCQSCCAESEAGKGQASVTIFVAVGTKPDPQIEEAVQQYYRRLATGGSECFDPALTDDAPGLESNVVSEPSAETCSTCASPATSEATLSLGCGNPVALAELKPGEIVLDIGCGAGADMFPTAEQVGPQGKVIGLDRLPEMLARARRTAQAKGYTNVEFRQGDALAIPLDDASVDVVMSNCVINLIQDKARVFREAFRVLKPGGRLVISDIVTDRPFSPELRRDPKSWAACVSGALPEAEYIALIAQAGFRDITTARSEPWTAKDGTRVYSLYIRAIKANDA